jgi:hypothetical protein
MLRTPLFTESMRVCGSETESHPAKTRRNSNVSKILPLTIFRTIDLGGKKISGRLFSRFCGELRVFLEVFSAPEYVQVAVT